MAKYKAKTKNYQLIVRARLSRGEKFDERALDIFSRNYIRGLLKAKQIRKRVIEYSGPIGISLLERLKKPVSKYDFFFMIEQMVDLSQKMQLNGLHLHHVVFDLSHVFINEMTKEVLFLYLPLQEKQNDQDIMSFIEKMIYSLVLEETEHTDCISRFLYWIRGLDGFDIDKIEQFIWKEDKRIVNTIKKHMVGQSGFMTDKRKDYYEHYNMEATGLLAEEDIETGMLEDEKTEILKDDRTDILEEGTGILVDQSCDSQEHFPTLYRILTKETIQLNKSIFCIGQQKGCADYIVSNNDAVSRNHAEVITKAQGCFVVDLGSTNKTYINGHLLPVQKEVKIQDGDRLRLANEEFIFYA